METLYDILGVVLMLAVAVWQIYVGPINLRTMMDWVEGRRRRR